MEEGTPAYSFILITAAKGGGGRVTINTYWASRSEPNSDDVVLKKSITNGGRWWWWWWWWYDRPARSRCKPLMGGADNITLHHCQFSSVHVVGI